MKSFNALLQSKQCWQKGRPFLSLPTTTTNNYWIVHKIWCDVQSQRFGGKKRWTCGRIRALFLPWTNTKYECIRNDRWKKERELQKCGSVENSVHRDVDKLAKWNGRTDWVSRTFEHFLDAGRVGWRLWWTVWAIKRCQLGEQAINMSRMRWLCLRQGFCLPVPFDSNNFGFKSTFVKIVFAFFLSEDNLPNFAI